MVVGFSVRHGWTSRIGRSDRKTERSKDRAAPLAHYDEDDERDVGDDSPFQESRLTPRRVIQWLARLRATARRADGWQAKRCGAVLASSLLIPSLQGCVSEAPRGGGTGTARIRGLLPSTSHRCPAGILDDGRPDRVPPRRGVQRAGCVFRVRDRVLLRAELRPRHVAEPRLSVASGCASVADELHADLRDLRCGRRDRGSIRDRPIACDL